MKLTAILILAAALEVSAKGHGQGITLSLKDASLEKTIAEIEKQSGYSFVYGKEQLAKAKTIDLIVRNEKLESVLDLVFKDQPLTYSISGKYIAIRQKVATSPTSENGKAEAQPPIDVHGRVVNEKGEPVVGATITVKGTNIRTASDDDGYFLLKGVDENAVIIISAVNIDPREIGVSGKTDLSTISVKIKVTEGQTVVVEANTGYQKIKSNEITGSITVITKEQLDQRVAPDIISKIEGIAPGLVFNKNPIDGSNNIRIRGESTIYGYNNPLIVIDNYPYPYEKINEINPNDIENITILKDASATSIWGSQAGNGVIVITTKKGRTNQKLRLELNANTTIRNEPDLFYKPNINPSDYIDYESFLFGKGYYNSTLISPSQPVVSPIVEILNKRKFGLISAADSASQINAYRNNDWRKEYSKYLYQDQIDQQYQINLSGGGNKTAYYFSSGYDRATSSIIGNKSDRISLSSRANYYPLKNLEVQLDMNYTESSSHSRGGGSISNIYPYMRLVDDNGNELPIPQLRAVFEDTIASHGFNSWKYYPLQDRKKGRALQKYLTTRMGGGIRYQIIKGLALDANYQYYRSTGNTQKLTDADSYALRNSRNRFAVVVNGNYTGTNYPLGGELGIESENVVYNSGRLKLDFNRSWKHNKVTALGGFEASEKKSETNSYYFYGYDDATGSFSTPNLFTSYPMYPSGSGPLGSPSRGLSNKGTLLRFRSFFGNVSYGYKDRYTIYASGRMDQANIFGVNTNDQSKPLYSIGGRWDISKEKFFNLKSLSSLSLRMSYGYQGNLSPSSVAILTIRYDSPNPSTGLPTASVNNFPNPELRWEQSGQFNIGVSFATSKNTISGSIDFFKKKGTDLIGDAPVDPTTGITTIRGNFSDIKSHGVDINVNSENFRAGKFSWNTSLNFGYASEKVSRYDIVNSLGLAVNKYPGIDPIVGYPIVGVYSYQWGGLDPVTGDPRIILRDTLNKSFSAGTINSIKFEDIVFNGRANPPVAGNIFNNFSWRGLSIGVNVVYKFGYYFRRGSIRYTELEGSWKDAHKDYALRWQKPGDEKFTNVPSLVYSGSIVNSTGRDNLYNFSDFLVEKGDHIRLQYINLNYRLSQKLTSKLGLQDLTIYFYANNLGIIWKATKVDLDPDYPNVDYPPSKSFSFGIKAGF